MTTPAPIEAWVAADRRGDLGDMAAQLDLDVVLVSPLTDQFTFRGPEQVMGVFTAAFAVLRDIEIANFTGAGDDWVVHGTNTLHGKNLEEIQWLHLGASGLIDRITLFIRPVPAAVAMLAAMGPELHKLGILPRGASFASRAAAPLAGITSLVEGLVMPRIGPDGTSPHRPA